MDDEGIIQIGQRKIRESQNKLVIPPSPQDHETLYLTFYFPFQLVCYNLLFSVRTTTRTIQGVILNVLKHSV